MVKTCSESAPGENYGEKGENLVKTLNWFSPHNLALNICLS